MKVPKNIKWKMEECKTLREREMCLDFYYQGYSDAIIEDRIKSEKQERKRILKIIDKEYCEDFDICWLLNKLKREISK